MQKQTSSSLLLVAAIAGGVGFVAFAALLLVGGFTVSPAAFLAIILAAAVAVFLFAALHKGPTKDRPDLTASTDGRLGNRTVDAGSAGVEPGTAGVTPGSVARGMPVTGRDTATAAGSAGAAAAATEAPRGSAEEASPLGPDHDDVAPGDVAGRADPVADRAESTSGQDRPLTTDDDFSADRRTTETGTTDTSDTTDAADTPASAATPQTSANETADSETKSAERTASATTETDARATSDDASSDDASDTAVGPERKWTSSQVKGSEELATRKGEWRYDGGTDDSGTSATATEDDAPVGEEPARLDAARDGGPDDLKRIKGVGPKMETMLNDMGFYHFDQIAGWSEAELAWVDSRLDGFKGRASRDEWVPQAKALAAGEETEFSRKVDGGDMY